MLNRREWANLLAALQYWTEEMAPHPDVMPFYPPVDHVKPLSTAELDQLRERLHRLPEHTRFTLLDPVRNRLATTAVFNTPDEARSAAGAQNLRVVPVLIEPGAL